MRGTNEAVAVFAISLGIAVLLQIAGGAYQSGFGGHPDEPAHLITALMVRDFLAGMDYRHPWQFAAEYYLHYPKVAIGHWPPALYATAGVWFLIFGASRATALLLIAIFAAATGTLLYFAGKRLIGRWAGGLAALLFLASPLVQGSSARFMTEHLVTLTMLASTLWFARFARTERVGDGFGFGIVAALAILTHGSGWALAVVPGLTIALTRKWHLLRCSGLWLATLPVLAICIPWYVFTFRTVEAVQVDGDLSFRLELIEAFSRYLYNGLGIAVLLLAAVGFYAKIIRPWRSRAVEGEWAALAGLAIGILALHCAVAAALEARYMVALVPSIVLFAAAGIAQVSVWLLRIFPLRLPVSFGLSLGVLLAFAVQSFALPMNLRNTGYETLAADISAKLEHIPQVWLISSGSIGEGSLIAAIALHEKRPGTFALRGSKILVSEDWVGRNNRDLYDTPDKLAALLNSIPVAIVAIDDRVPPYEHRPYHDRLRALIAGSDAQWEQIGSYTLVRGQSVFANAVRVYARRPVSALIRDPPAIHIGQIRRLINQDALH